MRFLTLVLRCNGFSVSAKYAKYIYVFVLSPLKPVLLNLKGEKFSKETQRPNTKENLSTGTTFEPP
jgi:hypothetical protein